MIRLKGAAPIFTNISSINFQNAALSKVIKDAYHYYVTMDVSDNMSFYALDIISRYLSHHEMVKDNRSFYAAALYIAQRHPYTYPNHETKSDFAKNSKIKSSSLEWYVDTIASSLYFIKIHDARHFPYYLDPHGIITSVIAGIISDQLNEGKIKHVLGIGAIDQSQITQDISARVVDRLKLVPPVFKPQIESVIATLIQQFLKKP